MVLPKSDWVRDTLEDHPTLTISREDVDSSIYNKGRGDTQGQVGSARRIDMSLVDYDPKCNADKMFWNAALKLYNGRVKFLPQDEAHNFVEQCWRTHICNTAKKYPSNNRLERAIRSGRHGPAFGDVVILSLLYGHDNIRVKPWYRKWASVYNGHWKMPQSIQGLLRQENLPQHSAPKGRKRKQTSPEQAGKPKKSAKGAIGSFEDDKDDEEPWLAMSMTQSRTPPTKVTTFLRRQSAVESENRTRQLYDMFPTGDRMVVKKDPIITSPTPIKGDRAVPSMVIVSDDEDDIAEKPRPGGRRSKACTGSATQDKQKSADTRSQLEKHVQKREPLAKPGKASVVQTEASQAPALARSWETSTLTDDQSRAALVPSTPDTGLEETQENADCYFLQCKDDLAERQRVISRIEVLKVQKSEKLARQKLLERELKATEKELEEAFAKLKTLWH